MCSKNLLPAIPPAFSDQLKRQTNERRCLIIRTNYNTQFAQAASELDEFRSATRNDIVQDLEDDSLSEIFQRTVQLTSYGSYAPLLAKLFEKPCKANAITDLLSPGLPDCVAYSSSTSGGIAKTIPRYNCLSEMESSDAESWAISDPLRRCTTARMFYLHCDTMSVEDEENHRVKTIYLSFQSVVNIRMFSHLHPESDEEKMGTFILDHTAPYAAAFITKWRTFLLIHALFALSSKSLELMEMIFINTFVDMMGYLDVEFDMVVDCIKNGTIPDLEGLDNVRQYLEPNLLPDPERAAELQSIGRPSSRPGWCGQVWPNLRSVSAVASGSFSSSVPLAQRYLGSNASIHSGGYGSTESSIVGLCYDPLELNMFKVSGANVIEFLGTSEKDASVSAVVQLWEVEVGRQYEVVVTSPDGLWRYRQGDTVEISGFDPTDGVPVFQFVERRSVALRLPSCELSERQLRAAMLSVPEKMLPNLVDWTSAIDYRSVPSTVGFFVELASDQGADWAPGVPDHVLDMLKRLNPNVTLSLKRGSIREPTVRLVRSGTFGEFKQMRLDKGSMNVGQIKVPIVLTKAEDVMWFSDRVVREL